MTGEEWAIRAVCEAHQRAKREALITEVYALRASLRWYEGQLYDAQLPLPRERKRRKPKPTLSLWEQS